MKVNWTQVLVTMGAGLVVWYITKELEKKDYPEIEDENSLPPNNSWHTGWSSGSGAGGTW